MPWVSNNILYESTVFNRSNNRLCGTVKREVKEDNYFLSNAS